MAPKDAKAAKEKAEKAAKAAKEKAAKEKAAIEKAAKEKVAKEKAAIEKAAKEKVSKVVKGAKKTKGTPQPETKGFLARIIEAILRFFGLYTPPIKKTPVSGVGRRIANVWNLHRKGLLGVIVPIAAFSWQLERFNNAIKVTQMWLVMCWWSICRPVNIPVIGLVPIFVLPLYGVVGSFSICKQYMNENIIFLFLGGMILLLLNNSGADRRIILKILTAGNGPAQYTSRRLLFKCAIASYLLSAFSNRLIVSSIIIEYATQALMGSESNAKVKSENYKLKNSAKTKDICNVIVNAIQSSSSIGSLALIHAAYTPLTFRSVFYESAAPKVYQDIFNYLQYSAFAFPVSLILFTLNLVYYLVLMGIVSGGPLSPATRSFVSSRFAEKEKELPKSITSHEIATILFLVISLVLLFTRWSQWLGGWSQDFLDLASRPGLIIPRIKDAGAAAFLVIIAHSVPYNWHCFKYLTASKKSQLPPPKPGSTILWFRFVDKNLNYGYFFVMGACCAIMKSAQISGLCKMITFDYGTHITRLDWNLATFTMVLIGTFLGNAVTGIAAAAMYLPFVLCAIGVPVLPWIQRGYLVGFVVGLSCSLGCMYPYMYTPAYFAHEVGKIPIMKMMIYSFGTWIISTVVLWLSLVFYAPILWPYPAISSLNILLETTTTTTTT